MLKIKIIFIPVILILFLLFLLPAQTHASVDNSTSDTNYIILYDSLITEDGITTGNESLTIGESDTLAGDDSSGGVGIQTLSTESMEQQYVDPEYSITELKDKMASFKKMKESGTGLLVSGLILLPTGIILWATGISDQNDNYYDPYSDPYDPYGNNNDDRSAVQRMFVGYIFTCVGIPLTVVGSILTGIGSGKYMEYMIRLERATGKKVSLNITGNSISFVYKF